jgi:ribosomal protein S18 acetylase RimI-like enzyme
MWFLTTLLWALLLLCCGIPSSDALIVSAAPPFRALTPSATEEQSPVNSQESISIRIRSTREDDIPQVATLLATAAVDDTRYNWAASIECLRRVASFQSLLLLRYQTIREGSKAASKVMQEIEEDFLHNHDDDEELLSQTDRLRLIWEQDAFRSKVQRAARMSSEPHLWKEYNFAVSPQDPRHLQHIMLTAEDVSSGTVVGFCEVAMMSGPNNEERCAAPTIANLATSPHYRRRGIAAGLLESVSRYVKQYWEEADDLALYVAKDNARAVSLYKKQGFQSEGPAGDDKWYMTVKTHAPVRSAALA